VPTAPTPAVRHRVPLGLLMISRGQLTNQRLRSALEAQRQVGRQRLGEWLEKLGFATEQQVAAALAQQWACPVLTPQANCDPASLRLLPYHLLEVSRMLPVQFVPSTRMFHLAFCDGIDYSALYAIEQMLECRTQACLASRNAVARVLQLIGHERRPGELLFEGSRDASEMARITCGYVLKLGAQAVRLVGCGSFIWARLSTGPDVANLLFHRPAENAVRCN
jgi:Type II secretion system (T2SS), protein E, N-terminal domain